MNPDLTAPLANNMDPDQTAPKGAVWSGFIVFASIVKNIQERIWQHFQDKIYWQDKG